LQGLIEGGEKKTMTRLFIRQESPDMLRERSRSSRERDTQVYFAPKRKKVGEPNQKTRTTPVASGIRVREPEDPRGKKRRRRRGEKGIRAGSVFSGKEHCQRADRKKKKLSGGGKSAKDGRRKAKDRKSLNGKKGAAPN